MATDLDGLGIELVDIRKSFVNASMKKPAIIVVSSHVARGAVGIRAAVFALERLGFPVIAMPSVLLSWHPGVGPATRIVPPTKSFAAIIDDLVGAPWLGTVGAILSGYLGESGQVAPIAALVEALKASNPDALYLCDPVVGDVGGPYVSGEIVRAIREKLLPLADIATPNRHELGLLGGGALSSNNDLVRAARVTGVEELVVTSAFAAPEKAANLLVMPDGVFSGTHPALPMAPHGTGDLLAALYLAHRLDGLGAPDALRLAVGSTFRLVEASGGADDLLLAEMQAALFEPHTAVSVARIG